MADRDLLGQADALLRRHSAGVGAETGGIPVLTDLVEPPTPATGEGIAHEIAQDVYRRVMGDVEGRLAAELEKRLVQHLSGEVHVAVASAVGDLRQDIANAIGDAVTQALERLKVK